MLRRSLGASFLSLGALLLVSLPAAAQPPSDVVVIEVVSGRGDLVTGGDVLLRLRAPADASVRDLTVSVDGVDATIASFGVQPDGSALALVTGLEVGPHTVRAELPDGRGAYIELINYPLGGPVFSGPQIQPWTCTNGSTRPDCGQDPTITYSYRPMSGGGLQPYDPAAPPSDVATTVTDEGNEVPFIVRLEVGYTLRDQYAIAALWDPAQGDWPDPTTDPPGYANKLVLTHGASCDTAYESGSAPDVLLADALAQGFAVASHALDNAGHNCNIVTQAESLVVTKELVAERFGPIRYTIGIGCSGGSLVQQQVANAYPGVYQGIIPQCSFPDAWSTAQQYVDYVLLRRYLEGPGSAEAGILPVQWPSIFGHANPSNWITFTEVIPNSGEPTRDCPGVPPEQVYDGTDNPDGVRCTLQDYMVNVFGVDPATGFARRPISNVGIQYGLSGLLAYLEPSLYGGDPTRPPLTPAQFVALNAGVGGFDIDFNFIPERTTADPLAQDRVYRSGAVNTGAHLDEVAIIDLGGPDPGAFHDVYRKYAMRDRLIREHGTAENQVFWEGPTPLLGDVTFGDAAIRAMDEWLAAVEADTRDVPLASKIIEARHTVGIGPRCTDGAGNDQPLSACDAIVDPTIYSSPRIEAGGGDPMVGFADDTLDCQTMPIDEFDYAGNAFQEVFTPEQQDLLRRTFPEGVCDYSEPGRGFQAAVPWLTYQDADGNVIYGGQPLGPPPVSIPYRRAAIGGPPLAAPAPLPATGSGLPWITVVAAAFVLRSVVARRRG